MLYKQTFFFVHNKNKNKKLHIFILVLLEDTKSKLSIDIFYSDHRGHVRQIYISKYYIITYFPCYISGVLNTPPHLFLESRL